MRPRKSDMSLIASLAPGLATVVTIWDSWQDIKVRRSFAFPFMHLPN